MLTWPRGIADPQAAPVWAGMEDASLRTDAMVSYLAVAGPNVTVVAAGPAERGAVASVIAADASSAR